jgi:hypothetical protein
MGTSEEAEGVTVKSEAGTQTHVHMFVSNTCNYPHTQHREVEINFNTINYFTGT